MPPKRNKTVKCCTCLSSSRKCIGCVKKTKKNSQRLTKSARSPLQCGGALTRLAKYKTLPNTYTYALNRHQKKNFRSKLTPDQAKFILDCVSNIQNLNAPLNRSAIKQLEKYKSQIKSLVSSSLPMRVKAERLSQSGGFIGVLFEVLTTVLPLILDRVFQEKKNRE